MADRFEDIDDYKPAPPEGADFDDWWATLTVKEQRIEVIRDMMAQGRWLRGVTSKYLAHQWQLSPSTVESIAAEASRSLKRYAMEAPEARDAIRDQILHTFEVIRAKAMSNGDAPSLRVALDATRTFGFWLGFEPAKRIDVSERPVDELDNMSDEQLDRIALGRQRRGALPEAVGDGKAPNGDDGPVH